MSKSSSVKEGALFNSKFGDFIITRYINSVNVEITFKDTGYTYFVTAANIRKGLVKDYSIPSIYGVGYNTLGKIDRSDSLNNQAMIKWKSMLRRCYSPKSLKNSPTYIGCIVCDEWLDFKNFRDWFVDNYKSESGICWELDKDLLTGYTTKIYSPETCSLIPSEINRLIVNCSRNKNNPTPIGVELVGENRYRSYCTGVDGKRVELGHYNTAEEAFAEYAKYKDFVLKMKAEEYKQYLTVELYNKLINYNTLERYK